MMIQTISTLETLLSEAETFHARLTAESTIVALEKRLFDGMSPLNLEATDPFADVCTGSGIYYLEAKFPFKTYKDLDDFGTRWGKAKAKNLPNSLPRHYLGRAKQHKIRVESGGFLPFYLGKETNLRSRLTGHMTGLEESTTYSLKLKTRSELLNNVELRFGFVEIPVQKSAYFCVELLEKALRNRLHPIIGRQ